MAGCRILDTYQHKLFPTIVKSMGPYATGHAEQVAGFKAMIIDLV